jgi:hypothetical protein
MQSVTIQVDGRPIDRTMPATLRGHLSAKDWTDFCNQHDEVAIPSISSRSLKSFPALPFLLVFIAAIVTLVLSIRREFTRDPFDGSSFSVGIPIGICLLMGTLISSTVCFGIVASRESEKFIAALKRLCEETSTKQSSLTFHFKSETFITPSASDRREIRTVDKYYIEVCIAETTVDASPIASYYDPEIAIASAPLHMSATEYYAPALAMSSSEASHSAAERLQELEKIKNLLSEKEYAQKRDDIIAAV